MHTAVVRSPLLTWANTGLTVPVLRSATFNELLECTRGQDSRLHEHNGSSALGRLYF